MSTDELQRQLTRIAETAPVAEVPRDTWQRARRSVVRDRVVAVAAATAVVGVVAGGVAWLPQRHEPEVAGTDSLGLPNRIELPPARMWERKTYHDDLPVAPAWARDEVSGHLGTGVASAAFVTGGLPVVVDAAAGGYHLLDLPDFLGNFVELQDDASITVSLSPDGRELAYGYVEFRDDDDSNDAAPAGVRVVDLETGKVARDVHIPTDAEQGLEDPMQRGGSYATSISWSPDGRWLVWQGDHSLRLTSTPERLGTTQVAGRIAPGSDVSESLGLPKHAASWNLAIADDGTVAESDEGAVRWTGLDGAVTTHRVDDDPDIGFSYGADYVGPTLHELRGPFVAYDVPYAARVYDAEGNATSLAVPDELQDRSVAVVGWVDDDHFLARVGSARAAEVADLHDLVLVGVGDDPSFRVVGELVDLPSLSVATGLVPIDEPTVSRPPPSWPWTPLQWAATLGLGLLLAGALVLAGRRYGAARNASWARTDHSAAPHSDSSTS